MLKRFFSWLGQKVWNFIWEDDRWAFLIVLFSFAFALIRIWVAFDEFENEHVQKSFEAFAHLWTGGLLFAWMIHKRLEEKIQEMIREYYFVFDEIERKMFLWPMLLLILLELVCALVPIALRSL